MKKIIFVLIGCLAVSGAMAAAGRGRVSMSEQMMAAPRATVSKNQISAMAATNAKSTTSDSALAVTPEQMVPAVKDMREKERDICLSNNIGVGNSFVWASRFSNLNNYASMVEDTDQPENNVCFVKVVLDTDDERIKVDDIPSKYFQMGQNIVCGSWVDENDMRERILDAKKTARVWGTVGGVVGGAGIGVGAMELFGNKLIGGKVEGQKSLTEREFAYSYVMSLKEENPEQYRMILQKVTKFKKLCEEVEYKTIQEQEVNQMCTKFDMLFGLV